MKNKNILIISTSSSAQSINKKIAHLVEDLLKTQYEVALYDLRKLNVPIYSIDIENNSGIPDEIKKLKGKIEKMDALVISTPEHNGSMPALFKNTIDWLSRLEGKILAKKPVMLTATSPGARGGQTNLNHLKELIPYWESDVLETFSLPSFQANFDLNLNQIINEEKAREFKNKVYHFAREISSLPVKSVLDEKS